MNFADSVLLKLQKLQDAKIEEEWAQSARYGTKGRTAVALEREYAARKAASKNRQMDYNDAWEKLRCFWSGRRVGT